MTEAEWQACMSINDILYYATHGHDGPGTLGWNDGVGPAGHVPPTPRQLALAVVGWAERAGAAAHDEATAQAIRLLSSGAEGTVGPEAVAEYRARNPETASGRIQGIGTYAPFILWERRELLLPVEAMEMIADLLSPLISPVDQCAVLRDVLGNPFRPVNLDPTWLTWHGGLLVSMARQMYESRDFRDMPILADALEEAGCTNPDILDHCRSGGEHVRGCWVIDLLLGKS